MSLYIVRESPNRVLFGRYRDGLTGTVLDRGVFPLRVIDLRETLDSEGGIAFRAPNDWSFHTVSHTWSQEIRQLSKEVADDIEKFAGSRYEDIFKRAKLRDRDCYASFEKFLKMLHTDGVQRIWFDALCINQSDHDEKNHEIAHMGAYYYHSVGCYAVAHGFGEGFRITNSNNELPRWFSRVWTLQEMLLPKTLTFIVELSNMELHKVVRSKRRDHVMAYCDCKGEAESLVWPWGDANPAVAGSRCNVSKYNRLAVQGKDENEFWRQLESSGCRCTRGRFQRVEGEVERYFAHIDAYAYIHESLSEPEIRPSLHRHQRIRDPQPMQQEFTLKATFQLIGELRKRFEVLQQGGLSAVVREICVRECSNEEDRVLAVLALLGLDGKMLNIRTKETLAVQLVKMCSVMAECNPGGLIELCTAFISPLYAATSTPLEDEDRLSWAPHFRDIRPYSWHSQFLVATVGEVENEPNQHEQLVSDFRHTVAKVSVNHTGLSLSCHMLKGRLIPSHHHVQLCTAGAKLFTNSKIGCSTCNQGSGSSFVLQIVYGHALGFNKKSGTSSQELVLSAASVRNPRDHNDYCEGGMVLTVDSSNDRIKLLQRLNFNVWLLLLGTFQARNPPTDFLAPKRVVLVFMVCVGERRDNLHKIGIVHMLPTYIVVGGRSTIPVESFETVDCTVGGFGKRGYSRWLVEQLNAASR